MVLVIRVMVLMLVFNVASSAWSQRANPVFSDPEIDPNLPNVLLIGDSISMGYMIPARNALKGKANVFRPKTNCGPTTKGVAEIEQWLGDRKWDLIHFNHGLHDLKYMGPKGQNLADPEAEGSHQQVPMDEYKKNLRTIAERLKRTGAVVIWRETTPVPEGSKGRVPGDSVKYNAAAAEVIKEIGGIATDPFYEFAMSVKKDQRPANVHYTPAGSQQLGQHVAEVIEKALKSSK